MLVSVEDNKVQFCELVEHPGGHDGGEFPQYTTYGVADDGSCFYSTEFPQCPTDSFCDEEEDDYVEHETHEDATQGLLAELKEFYGDAAAELPVYKKFSQASDFVIYFEDEVYEAE